MKLVLIRLGKFMMKKHCFNEILKSGSKDEDRENRVFSYWRFFEKPFVLKIIG